MGGLDIIQKEIQEATRLLNVRHRVYDSFATYCDAFVVAHRMKPEEHAIAVELAEGFMKYISVSTYANTNGADYHPISLLKDPPPDRAQPHARAKVAPPRQQPKIPKSESESKSDENCLWHNYAVSGLPVKLPSARKKGDIVEASALVAREVELQTMAKPDYCRPTKIGPDPATGKMTWIISFIGPVPAFSLFGYSDKSQFLSPKPAIAYHNLGCQGYCRPSKCTRLPRCSNCGQPMLKHSGPTGYKCRRPSRCANCHHPHPADDPECLVAPPNLQVKISKEELQRIRAEGNALYLAQNPKVAKNP
ncbi:hypothetical protein N7456_004515 [Penicillium angulare]|uniref:Uncharacterized protein n=1 Tax=Penicillium angulare TaxID=116970 RepID=A0A9W9FXJ8_9EURO|nr:hypothetical protein N7456_004515 [Penicillium angulare]